MSIEVPKIELPPATPDAKSVASHSLTMEDVFLAWRDSRSVEEIFEKLDQKKGLVESLGKVFPKVEIDILRKQARAAVQSKMGQLKTGFIAKSAKANKWTEERAEKEVEKILPSFGQKKQEIPWGKLLNMAGLAK